MFNDEQRAYMEELDRIPLQKKCWCGWDMAGECYNCKRDDRLKDKTCADKMALACPECGSTPSVPEWPVFHLRYCKLANAETGEK